MKSIKTRLVSAFLLIMTILSLFPTTAFAASSTGKGITITKNQNYWSTRLLANGTPYSYRPPSHCSVSLPFSSAYARISFKPSGSFAHSVLPNTVKTISQLSISPFAFSICSASTAENVRTATV